LVDKAEFLRLMTPEALGLLDQTHFDDKADVVAVVSRLRAAGHDAELVATVLSQAKLRRRARAKFGEFADRMLFTEDGLEQATRLRVAALHAGRFREAAIGHVADLGCGIGTESMALASLGLSVSAFEIDEVTAAIAAFNLAGFDSVTVTHQDATGVDLASFDGLMFDPARRELGGPKRDRATRKFDPVDYSPRFDWALEQARSKPTGIKLGPGHPHEGIPDDCEAQWVSVGGDLVECTLWFGAVARQGVARSALLLNDAGSQEINSSSFERLDAPLGELGALVHEPDAGVIRGHLVGELAEQLGARLFAPEIAYLTTDAAAPTPWARSYRVLDELAFDRKRLKAYLRERNIGVLEIKKRGADVVPEQLRKEMALKGENAATLIVTRVGDAHRVLVVEPIR
jgi:SAM-dependent methyltransferase